MNQGVNVEISDRDGLVVMTLRSMGVADVPIALDVQAAHELSEKLVMAAHSARTGSGLILLPESSNDRAERKRPMLIRRVEVMLNSLRNHAGWSNKKLAAEIVDQVAGKVV